MTLPVWPTGLPYAPTLGSLQVPQTVEAPVRTDMNAGTTRARRRVSLPVARVAFSIRLTFAQVPTFRTFHETTLGDGSARFTMPIAFAGQVRNETVQFAEPPSYQDLGGKKMLVSISLRVEKLGSGPLV